MIFKNRIKDRACYSFDDMIKFEDFDFGNILIDEKSYENILTYVISCKTLKCSKLLDIWFNKTYGFTRIYDGTWYLVLFRCEKYLK